MLKNIKFVTLEGKLKEMAYNDSIYAWLLLHSHYDETENHNYIYKKDFTFIQIARDIHKTRQTVSRRFEELLSSERNNLKPLIYYDEKNEVYLLPNFREFEKLDSDTVLNLFWMYGNGGTKKKEELIKVYAWLKKKMKIKEKEISLRDLATAFGHSLGNRETYERYKYIMTTLQGAGLIKFRTALCGDKNLKGHYEKTFYVYQVNDRASQEWIDKKK